MHKNCGKGNIIMVQLLYYQRKETTTLEKMMRCLVPENKTYSQLQTFQEADKQKLRDLEKIDPMMKLNKRMSWGEYRDLVRPLLKRASKSTCNVCQGMKRMPGVPHISTILNGLLEEKQIEKFRFDYCDLW